LREYDDQGCAKYFFTVDGNKVRISDKQRDVFGVWTRQWQSSLPQAREESLLTDIAPDGEVVVL